MLPKRVTSTTVSDPVSEVVVEVVSLVGGELDFSSDWGASASAPLTMRFASCSFLPRALASKRATSVSSFFSSLYG